MGALIWGSSGLTLGEAVPTTFAGPTRSTASEEAEALAISAVARAGLSDNVVVAREGETEEGDRIEISREDDGEVAPTFHSQVVMREAFELRCFGSFRRRVKELSEYVEAEIQRYERCSFIGSRGIMREGYGDFYSSIITVRILR